MIQAKETPSRQSVRQQPNVHPRLDTLTYRDKVYGRQMPTEHTQAPRG